MIRKKRPPTQAAGSPGPQKKPTPPAGYEQHQGEISLRMSHFFIRYLTAIYREFSGDLALVIVIGEIAHHNVSRYYSSQGPLPPLDGTNYDDKDLYARLEPCNAFSLAAATGIPRETVRRKIDQLVKRGWLHRTRNGSVQMLPALGQYFRPDFNVRLLEELLELSEQLKTVLASPPRKPRLRPAPTPNQ